MLTPLTALPPRVFSTSVSNVPLSTRCFTPITADSVRFGAIRVEPRDTENEVLPILQTLKQHLDAGEIKLLSRLECNLTHAADLQKRDKNCKAILQIGSDRYLMERKGRHYADTWPDWHDWSLFKQELVPAVPIPPPKPTFLDKLLGRPVPVPKPASPSYCNGENLLDLIRKTRNFDIMQEYEKLMQRLEKTVVFKDLFERDKPEQEVQAVFKTELLDKIANGSFTFVTEPAGEYTPSRINYQAQIMTGDSHVFEILYNNEKGDATNGGQTVVGSIRYVGEKNASQSWTTPNGAEIPQGMAFDFSQGMRGPAKHWMTGLFPYTEASLYVPGSKQVYNQPPYDSEEVYVKLEGANHIFGRLTPLMLTKGTK